MLTLLVLLAGCTVSPSDVAADAARPDASEDDSPSARVLDACAEIITIVPVAKSNAATLPEGFTHAPFEPTGTTVDYTVISASCGQEMDVFFMHKVVPPADWNDESAAVQVYLVDLWSTEDGAAWYANQAVNAKVLDDWTHRLMDQEPGSIGDFTGSAGSLRTTQHVMVGQPSEEPAGHGWLWYTAEDGELALLRVDLGPRTMSIGTGVLQDSSLNPLSGFGATMVGDAYDLRLTRMGSPNPYDAP